MQVSVRRILEAVALFAILYQAVSVIYPVHGALAFYYFHLGLVLVIAALNAFADRIADAAIARRTAALWICGIIIAGTVLSTGYLHMAVSEIEMRQPFITTLDFAAGAAMLFCVIILTYFVWGAVLASLVVLSILYFSFGQFAPSGFRHNPPSGDVIMSYLAGMGGARGALWGIPLSANTLFLILVFGGLLKGTRILELFNELGKLMLTVSRAGVAYSALLSSTLIGMVTGQAVANIALSGSVTIPAMQQRGMSGEAASAVEVNASLASQIVPPVMGLGAFLMAVNMGVPYADIALAAVLPAALYLASLVLAVRFLVAATPTLVEQTESVDRAKILWMFPSFAISFGVLLALLYSRYSPAYAAFWAIALLLMFSFFRPKVYRPDISQLLGGVVYGAVAAANLGLILAAIGVLIQVLITTGAGFDMGRMIMTASGDSMWLALFYGMILSLIVGLGLPTPAAYALIAIIMIPFLIDVGVPEMAAHFFGFYFAIFSAITPPVAVGIMTASKISGAPFYRTVLHSGRIALVLFLIPFTMVAFPNLLQFPSITLETVVVCAALLATTAAWAAAIYGFLFERLSIVERGALLVAPLLYIFMLVSGSLFYAGAIFTLIVAQAIFRMMTKRNGMHSCAATQER